MTELLGTLDDVGTSSESFSLASKRILFTRTLLHQVSWRRTDLLERAMVQCVEMSNSPYKQVRQQVGIAIHTILCALWIPFAVDNNNNNNADAILSSIFGQLEKLLKKLEIERSERKASTAPTLEKPSDYVDTSKTILYWFHETFTRYRAQCAYPFVEPFLQPLIQMSETDDSDLLSMSSILGMLVAKTSPPSTRTIVKLLLDGTAWSSVSSWKVKLSLLVYFQTTVFRNLFYLGEEIVPLVKSFLLFFLKDNQLEVREFAGQIVSGLIRCSAIQPGDLLPCIEGWLSYK